MRESLGQPKTESTEKLFPKIHAVILLPTSAAERRTPYKEYDGNFAVDVWIHRPIQSETLASLFRYPVRWDGSPASARHPIGAVSSVTLVTLASNGALVGSKTPRNGPLIRNTVSKFWIDTRECVRNEQMEESLREAVRLAPPSRGPGFAPPVIGMIANSKSKLEACLANVSDPFGMEATKTHIAFFPVSPQIPHIFWHAPQTSVEIEMYDNLFDSGKTDGRTEFRSWCTLAAATYARIWDGIGIGQHLCQYRIQPSKNGHETNPFFSMYLAAQERSGWQIPQGPEMGLGVVFNQAFRSDTAFDISIFESTRTEIPGARSRGRSIRWKVRMRKDELDADWVLRNASVSSYMDME
jgi:hypothetical protein